MNTLYKPKETINAILFILENMNNTCDFHKIFKILYFADQKHLVKYGTPITGNMYTAMKNGPVPSEAYDILKNLRENVEAYRQYKMFFDIQDWHIVIAKQKPKMEELAESNIECLAASIEENKDLSFEKLSEKSHGYAWNHAKDYDNAMDIVHIAKEAHAHEEMLKYIRLNIENQNLFQKCD